MHACTQCPVLSASDWFQCPHVIHVVLSQQRARVSKLDCFDAHLQSVARMVRRKQQNPRALLGPPESRQADADVSNGHSAALPAQQSRSRPGGPAVVQKNLTVLTNVRSLDDNLLPLRHLQIDCKDLRSSLTASTQPSLCFSITPEPGDLDIAWNASSSTSQDPRTLNVGQGQHCSALRPLCTAALARKHNAISCRAPLVPLHAWLLKGSLACCILADLPCSLFRLTRVSTAAFM